jgi:alanine-synthesizing transaminase
VTAQWAVLPALQDAPTIGALTAAGGRLHEARRVVLESVAASQYLDLVTPDGALYAFPQVRADHFAAFDDNAFALRLLEEESVLVVPGSSFNVPRSRHFRLTLLPPPAQLHEVFVRIERVLARMALEQPQRTASVVESHPA